MRKHPICALALLIAISVPVSCTRAFVYSGVPAASVDDEIITRDFIAYSLELASKRGGEKTDSRQALENYINTALLAYKSRELGLHKSRAFKEKERAALIDVRLNYLCRESPDTARCEGALSGKLRNELHVPVPAISWDRVFLRAQAGPIPYMGAIPPVRKAGFQVNNSYCDTVRLGSPARSLFAFLDGIPREDLNLLSVLGAGERERHFEKLVLSEHLGILIHALSLPEKRLLSEIETRQTEKLLADEYRRHLGFGQDGKDVPTARKIAISDAEAREFYTRNKEGFAVTLWVDISHVRFDNQGDADEAYRRLKEGKEDFCSLVTRYSKAPDKVQCGHVGKIARETAAKGPMYRSIAFAIPAGTAYSMPFRTGDGGIEIIRVNDRKTRLPAFDEPGMKKSVVTKMLPRKRQELLVHTLEEMRKTHRVTVHPERL